VDGRDLDVIGSAHLRADSDPDALSTVLRGSVDATAALSIAPDEGGERTEPGRAVDAVDDDVDTGWTLVGPAGAGLDLAFPEQPVRSVRILSSAGEGWELLEQVTVLVGDDRFTVELRPAGGCDPDDDGSPRCSIAGALELDESIVASSVSVLIPESDPEFRGPNSFGPRSVRIDEIVVNDGGNPGRATLLDRSDPLPEDCVDVGLRFGRTAEPDEAIPVSFVGTVGDLLDGDELEVASCVPIEAEAGTAYVDAGELGLLDIVGLRSTDWDDRPVEVERAVGATATRTGRFESDATLDGPSIVVLQQSFDPRWQLEIDGVSAGSSMPVDAGNGWIVEHSGQVDLVAEFDGERKVTVAVWVSLFFVVLCGLLITARPRRFHLDDESEVALGDDESELVDPGLPRSTGAARVRVAIGAATIIGVAFIGLLTIVVGLGVWLVSRRTNRPERFVGLVPPLLLAMAAAATIGGGTGTNVNVIYPASRTAANDLVIVAIVFVIHVIALAIAHDRPDRSDVATWTWRLDRTRIAALLRSRDRLLTFAIAVVAGVVRAATLGPVDERIEQLVANIDLGLRYSTVAVGDGVAVDLSPLAWVLVALLGMPPMVLAGVAAAATALLTSELARRVLHPAPGWPAAALIAVLPVTWSVSLSTTIAAACAAGAGVALFRRRESAVSGVVLGSL
ncbi:hypothetical protein, partial [Ilumatobacter sp.]|uniref:hypothetical protein n=1 Tax=Ilumatobacter sp. TaxID=1967498 RepID=UPI003C4DA1F6